MTATSAPFGLIPISHPSGQVRNEVILNGVTSGYTSNIGFGTPVRLDPTTRKLVAAAVNQDYYGVFAGCQYKQSATAPLVTLSKNFIANTTYIGDFYAFVWTDPDILYKIQANGSLTQATALGNQADFVNPGVVNTLGNSTAAISTTLLGTGVQGQMRIMNIYPGVDNSWGDAFTVVEVQIARQQNVANKTAI